MKTLQNAGRLMLLAGAFLFVFPGAAMAAGILVTSGKDTVPPATPIAGSLRAALAAAVPGTVITFSPSLVLQLEHEISLPEGVTLEGPALITVKPSPNPNLRPFESINVITAGVTLKNLNFRNIGLTIGRSDIDGLPGFKIQGCKFNQAGHLTFAHTAGALVDNNRFEITDDRGQGYGSLTCNFTKDTSIINNTFENGVEAGGIRSSEDENLLIENNTVNEQINLAPRSVRIIGNRLPKRRIFVTMLSTPHPGAVEISDNVCGILQLRGINLTVQRNKVSGKLLVEVAGNVPGTLVTKETLALVSLQVEGNRAGDDTTTSAPVLIEENTITGGRTGMLLSAGAGLTRMTVNKNQLSNVTNKGIVLQQTAPVTVSNNVLQGCGVAPFLGKYPAGLDLVGLTTADVLVETNTIKDTGDGAYGIAITHGSPLLKNNTISDGPGEGIRVFKGATPLFEGNTVQRMGRGGVVLDKTANVSMDGITLTANGLAGILVKTGASLNCTNAIIEKNRGPGILFRAESKGTVSESTIAHNRAAGVYLLDRARADLRTSTFGGNVGAGIDIDPLGITPNALPKRANGGIDFPEQLEYDAGTKQIRGKSEAGAVVQLFRSEIGARTGNGRNGEGVVYAGQTLALGDGMFAISPGSVQEGDLFCLTATRLSAQPVTSEFSKNLRVPPAPAITRVSVSSAGEEANDFSGETNVGRILSDNGRFVAFSSLATNLVNNDTNQGLDVFVRDVTNATTERVSVNSAGEESPPGALVAPAAFAPSMTADGRYVAFVSSGRNLLPGDPSSNYDVCLRDRQEGTTTGVTDPVFRDTTKPAGQQTRTNGREPAISADGSAVAFVTTDGGYVDGDSNSADDIYVWTRATGAYERISLTTAGAQIPSGTNFATGYPRLSANGRYVVFTTFATLVPGNTVDGSKVYIRDRQSSTTTLVSLNGAGTAVSGVGPSISADGRYVAFVTPAALDPADTNGTNDVYVRDQDLGTLQLCSKNLEGSLFTGHTSQPSLSADGRHVAFVGPGGSTRDGFTQLHPDVYIFDRQTGLTREASIGLSGDGTATSNTPSLSADGRFLSFQSQATNLVDADTNSKGDIFLRDRAAELAAP